MNSMNRSMTYPSTAVALALACFVVLPNAPAVNPPPDGGYPGGNTAQGENALLALPAAGSIRQLGLGRSEPLQEAS